MMDRIIGRWNRELQQWEGKNKDHKEYVPLQDLAPKVCPECERELPEEYTRCWSCQSWGGGREI